MRFSPIRLRIWETHFRGDTDAVSAFNRGAAFFEANRSTQLVVLGGVQADAQSAFRVEGTTVVSFLLFSFFRLWWKRWAGFLFSR
jgi:hypothetical protein